MKKVLILGSGGREHALAYRVAEDEQVSEVIVMPGNPGMTLTPKVKTIDGDINDKEKVLDNCIYIKPDLVIIGPEKPLVDGLVDYLEDHKIVVFGPRQNAAEIEGSKIFSKNLMEKYGVPTAASISFNNYEEALQGIDNWNFEENIVVKTDALAGGKGVVVTRSKEEARSIVSDFMNSENCLVQTHKILFEQELKGKELSVFAVCDGEDFKVIGKACDYKRIGEGNNGPNTGGMGCYNPLTWPNDSLEKRIEEEVFRPILLGMKEEGRSYKGILFAGLMISGDKINVIEFNARFGDPETQVLMPLIEGNLTSLLESAAKGKIDNNSNVTIKNKQAVHVVLSSKGYPNTTKEPMELGHKIDFPKPEVAGNSKSPNKLVFLAGVKNNSAGDLINSGGRVLGVTTLADTIDEAREIAYGLIESDIKFNGAYWRRDIGK